MALITGAGNGIRRVSTELITAEGGRVAAVDYDRELRDGAMNAFAQAGGGPPHTCSANALRQEEVDAVVADTIDRFGRIDILLNGVGGSTIIANAGARDTVDAGNETDIRGVVVFVGTTADRAGKPSLETT